MDDPRRHHLFTALLSDPLIIHIAEHPLEIVPKLHHRLEPTGDLGQDQAAAEQHPTDHLTDGGLLRRP
jgi:hypothetical protein